MTTRASDDRRIPRLSLRARIVVGAATIVAIVLLGVSLLVLRLEANAVGRAIDLILVDEAVVIGQEVAAGRPAPLPFDPDRILVVLDPDGEVVAGAGDYDELRELTLDTDARDGTERHLFGEPHRVIDLPYTAPDGRRGSVRVAEPLDKEFGEAGRTLVRSLAVIAPAAILLLTLLVWFVVGRALRPVDRMRAEVDEFAFEHLDRRVVVPRTDDEISRLAITMNRMLDRLATAAHRQQRFVADASHELRTPLARMRAELETTDPAAFGTGAELARRSQLDEIAGLQQMVDDLLVLARSDAELMNVPMTPVDLDDLVLEEARAVRNDRVVVDTHEVSGAQVLGRRGDLRRVVRNLLENACRHAHSQVAVVLRESEDTVVLHVDDDGPGVPRELRSTVFERFSRLPDDDLVSRRTGLGLAIVRDLVLQHSGTVTVGDSPLGGARFTVVFTTRIETAARPAS